MTFPSEDEDVDASRVRRRPLWPTAHGLALGLGLLAAATAAVVGDEAPLLGAGPLLAAAGVAGALGRWTLPSAIGLYPRWLGERRDVEPAAAVLFSVILVALGVGLTAVAIGEASP